MSATPGHENHPQGPPAPVAPPPGPLVGGDRPDPLVGADRPGRFSRSDRLQLAVREAMRTRDHRRRFARAGRSRDAQPGRTA